MLLFVSCCLVVYACRRLVIGRARAVRAECWCLMCAVVCCAVPVVVAAAAAIVGC